MKSLIVLLLCLTAVVHGQVSPQGAVVAWGANNFGQSTVPLGASTGVVEVDCRQNYSVALRGDGTVIAWGQNNFGQRNVPAGLTGVVDIAAGDAHVAALKSDGSVVVWGAVGFNYGQTNVPAAAQSSVVAIASGNAHILAVKSDGTVVAWGKNDFGQVNVPAGLTDVIAVAAGTSHSVALRRDGSMVAWGSNTRGQTNVPSGLSPVVDIHASNEATLALTCRGTVAAWGQFFNSTSFVPIYVPAGLDNVTVIGDGALHWLAHKTDGTIVAWGRSNEGQTTIPAGLTNVVALASGYYHSLAIQGNAPRFVNRAPVAYAGWNQQKAEGSLVTLDACLSFDRDRDSLSFQWTQVSGPPVVLNLTDPKNPTFIAPAVTSSGIQVEFRLDVNDGYVTSTDNVNVAIDDLPQALPSGTLSENFNNGYLPPGYQTAGASIGFVNGRVVNLSPSRAYFRTIATNYYSRSFIAEVTVTLDNIAFFGMGTGSPNPGFFDEPAVPSINLRMSPTGVVGGRVDAGDNVNSFSSPLNTFGNLGSETHRLRLTWDANAKTATFQVDQHYTGGAFVADFTSVPVNGADNGFSDGNTRIFFGGQEFDDLIIRGIGNPPIANAGVDFSVNEGQSVELDGSASTDPDGDVVSYSWAQLTGGTPVVLTGANTAHPTFTSPSVPVGGETLSFELTVTANGEVATDAVSVSVVNVNHPPVADAGDDQTVAEGAPVTLHGESSFDIDNDTFGYSWVQVGGTPTVALGGADTANPTFAAPFIGTGGAPGVVATLTFELRVDDGFPQDAPAPGFTFANVVDQIVVQITNTNNQPVAMAGADQTADENTVVGLSGSASSDPDGDSLAYSWAQISGPTVVLAGDTTATPTFTAPFANVGGANLEFELTASDGYGGVSSDRIVIHVQNINDPPLATGAQPTVGLLWPPNHQLVAVGITGVSDPDNNATITITAVTQDEPTNGLGDGDTPVDAIINPNGTVLLRAERSGKSNGRVYRVYFTASDLEGSASGVVVVSVPHSVKKPTIDSLGVFDSTQ